MAFQTLGNAPIPSNDVIALPKRPQYGERPDPQQGKISPPWMDFLTRVATVVGQAPNRLNSVALADQAASISATDMGGGALTAGLYAVEWYAHITQAAGVSSSLTVTLDFTEGGVALSKSFPAITGNTTSTWDNGRALIRIDAESPVRYAATYASTGAPVMQYRLEVVLTLVKA